jgi:predicted O-methyltransferase YrrM
MGLLSVYRIFWRTHAPAGLYGLYPVMSFRRRMIKSQTKATNREISRRLDGAGRFTTRYFDDQAAHWLRVFAQQGMLEKDLNVLEIGAWEGRATVFLLQTLAKARVTSVDTWQGSDEHAGDKRVESIEALFDANVAAFGNRLRKRKGTSLQYFAGAAPEEQFDLIYVDGSHFADDVVCDAVESFRRLKPGGVMIFDDYLWNWYPNIRHNPAFAINWLLRAKQGEYRILSVSRAQLMLKKLMPGSSRAAE